MSKRLAFLEQLVSTDKADSFAFYGLAMEYKTLGRAAEALSTFEQLKARDAEYLPMYLMVGQLLIGQQKLAEAREWLEAGIELATRQGNTKTLGELEDALEDC